MVFICSKMPLIDKLELQRDKVYENKKSDHFSALSQENEERAEPSCRLSLPSF